LNPSSFSLFAEEIAVEKYEVDDDVEDFLDDFEDAVEDMDTYTYVMTSKNWKGRRRERKVTKFYFKEPNLIRTEVLEGKRKGSTVVLNDEGKIRGRNSWGFRSTLKPTDRRLQNIRGSTFLRASLLDKAARMNDQILEKKCRATLTEEEWEGRPAYRLHIYHNNTYADATNEDIWFDKETYFILKDVLYVNDKVVADVSWKDHELNIPLDDSFFEL
jgi:outer membrane lipoprotein-sorting protein